MSARPTPPTIVPALEQQTNTLRVLIRSLAAALTPDDVAAVILRDVPRVVSAHAAVVGLLRNEYDELDLIRLVGLPDSVAEHFHQLLSDTAVPWSNDDGPAWLEQATAICNRYAEIAELGIPFEQVCGVALRAGDRVIGGLLLLLPAGVVVGLDGLQLVATLAELCGQAMDRAAAYMAERRARNIAERLQQANRFLAEVSATLAGTLDYETTVEQVAALTVPFVADLCLLYGPSSSGAVSLQAVAHAEQQVVRLLRKSADGQQFDLLASRGLPQPVRNGEAVFSNTIDSFDMTWCMSPQTQQLLHDSGAQAIMVVPLAARRSNLGMLVLCMTDSGRRFGFESAALGEDLARRAALAIDNARLHRNSVEAEQRATFLANASDALAASLDHESTLDTLARLSVSFIGDWCIVDVLDDKHAMEQSVTLHSDEGKQALVEELRKNYTPTLDSNRPTAVVMRTGQPLLQPVVDASWLDQNPSVTPRYRQILEQLQLASLMVVPLVARGRMVGVLSIGSTTPGCFDQQHLALAQDLANRSAIAIDNSRLYRAANEAVQMRDVFMSIASHELKTPLTSLLGYVSLIQRRASTSKTMSERDQRAVQVIGEQAQRLNRLVSLLLDISRIQSGQLALDRAVVDVGELARQAVENYATTLKDHTLEIEITDDLLFVHGDHLRIDQILHNMVQNAVKYSPEGGTITISVSGDQHNVIVAVRDSGIGIPKDALPRLFERFYRAPNADPRHISGMGIGLYVVKQIVELHGGDIHVESEVGKGSAFTVTLPRTFIQH